MTLNAKYDSYLLLFDRVNKSKIELSVGPKMLKNDESCYWVFSKEKSWTNWDNGFAFGLGFDRLELILKSITVIIGNVCGYIYKAIFINSDVDKNKK